MEERRASEREPESRSGRRTGPYTGPVTLEPGDRERVAGARRFHVRTFGCQMNEHDSERLAGLLVAEGMEPTDDVEYADVVVLNTCCIRENADNEALRAPRPPEGAQGPAARTCRSRSAAASPRRTAS